MMLVLDKPAGVAVHRGPADRTSLEDGFNALRFGLREPPRLAHRLDRDTSGCLVLGRHPKALRQLSDLFAGGRVEKVYWAVVEGDPPEPQGRVDIPLAKAPPGSGAWMRADPGGEPSATLYRLLASAAGRSWIEARPLTGRTHQIRVHMASLGCPIVGDRLYGARDRSAMLHLHARAVAVPLNPRRDPVRVEAPAPDHMRAALERLGLERAG